MGWPPGKEQPNPSLSARAARDRSKPPYEAHEVADALRRIEDGQVGVVLSTPHGADVDPEFRARSGWRFCFDDEYGAIGILIAFAGPSGDWTVLRDDGEDGYLEIIGWSPVDRSRWPGVEDGRSPRGYPVSADA